MLVFGGGGIDWREWENPVLRWCRFKRSFNSNQNPSTRGTGTGFRRVQTWQPRPVPRSNPWHLPAGFSYPWQSLQIAGSKGLTGEILPWFAAHPITKHVTRGHNREEKRRECWDEKLNYPQNKSEWSTSTIYFNNRDVNGRAVFLRYWNFSGISSRPFR